MGPGRLPVHWHDGLADLNALIGNYGKTGPVSSSVVIAGMGVSTVPEPSTLVLLAIAALAASASFFRRRKSDPEEPCMEKGSELFMVNWVSKNSSDPFFVPFLFQRQTMWP